MNRLLSRFPNFRRVITTTSRKQRFGEKNHVDYHFISEADFRRKINDGDFIEYVKYGGNIYGTEKYQILGNLGNGLIWRIDPSRAGEIKKFIKNAFDETTARNLLRRAVEIYLTVDDDVVLKRLKKRGLSQEEIASRMEEDAKFWQEFKNNYDFIIENVPGQLDQTVAKVCEIIHKMIGSRLEYL